MLHSQRPSGEQEPHRNEKKHNGSLVLRCCWPRDFVTFRVSRRRREMYSGHARLSVRVSVRGRMPTLLHVPGSNLAEW